jgi:hypothetical protein
VPSRPAPRTVGLYDTSEDRISPDRALGIRLSVYADSLVSVEVRVGRFFSSASEGGVSVHFLKEGLTFTGEDAPMANLMLSVMGAVAQFERDLIRER